MNVHVSRAAADLDGSEQPEDARLLERTDDHAWHSAVATVPFVSLTAVLMSGSSVRRRRCRLAASRYWLVPPSSAGSFVVAQKSSTRSGSERKTCPSATLPSTNRKA